MNDYRSDRGKKTRPRLQILVGLGVVLFVIVIVVGSKVWWTADDQASDFLEVSTEIQIPCADPVIVPPLEEPTEGQPGLTASPPCGVLPEAYDDLGSTLTVRGYGLAPNMETELWWQDHLGDEFRQRQAGQHIEVLTDQHGAFQIDIAMPYRIYPPNTLPSAMTWELNARQGENPKDRPPPVKTALIVEHARVSLTGWFFGVITGGILGYALARFIRSLFTESGLPKLAVFLPWRTILLALMVPLGFPVLIVIQFGLGAKAGTISVGLITFLLALAYSTTILLQHWYPTPISIRFIAWARTMATASVVFEVFAGYYCGSGAGSAMFRYVFLLDHKTALKYYAAVTLIMLATDLFFGCLQYFAAMKMDPTNRSL